MKCLIEITKKPQLITPPTSCQTWWYAGGVPGPMESRLLVISWKKEVWNPWRPWMEIYKWWNWLNNCEHSRTNVDGSTRREWHTEILICLHYLAVSLMILSCKLASKIPSPDKRPPNLASEWHALTGNNIQRNTLESKNMLYQKVSRLEVQQEALSGWTSCTILKNGQPLLEWLCYLLREEA